MKLGEVLKKEREKKKISVEAIAQRLQIPPREWEVIESGDSPLENYAALLQQFAKMIDQPVNELFYPCGLPFQELDDYP